MTRSWSPAAEQKLRSLYGRESLPRLAFLLKRTEKAVLSRAKVLGLKTGKRHPWSDVQLRILQREYADTSTARLIELTGHSKPSIYQQAQKLGLRKSATFHENAKLSGRFDKLSRAGEAFRFPKGFVPANKGLRRPGYAPGRMATTQFKKGQKPHTYRFKVGDERINTDGYIDVKISEDRLGAMNWRAKHRILWEKAHGPVPPGHVVAFKDGNKLNCVLENLELLTLGQNGARNIIWRKMPKELAALQILRGRVVTQINKRLGKHEPRKERDNERRKVARRTVRHALRAARQGKSDGDRASEGSRAGR